MKLKGKRFLALLLSLMLFAAGMTAYASGESQVQESAETVLQDSGGTVTNSKGISVKQSLLCDDPDCLEEHVGETFEVDELPVSEAVPAAMQASRAVTRMLEDVSVGMSLSGSNASVLFLGTPGTAGAFSVSINDGGLSGASGTGYCLNHGAANPGEGGAVTCSWTAECTAVEGNMATWSFVMTPPGACTPGSVLGYQRVGMVAAVPFEEPKGNLEIRKSSSNLEMTAANACYSLAGAVYKVYQGSTEVATLTTDDKGNARATGIRRGSYTVKEVTPPKGYALDTAVYNVTINSGNTTMLNVKDTPQSDPVYVLLGKIDRETTQNMPQGSATLEGAEYTVKYYDVLSDTDPAEEGKSYVRSWVFATNEKGFLFFDEEWKVAGDEFYYNSAGDETLPIGTITIQETKAPKGYLLNSEVYVRQITTEGTAEGVETYNQPEVLEQVKRGDIKGVKAADKSQERLADVPFEITSKTTGESHIIVTDRNGEFNTSADWTPHTQNTNEGTSSEDGVWFGEYTDENGDKQMTDADDELGALPYDTYIIEELRCDANEGYTLIPAFEVTVYQNDRVINLGTLTDDHKTKLLISKTDAATGEQVEGASLELYRKNGKEWELIDSAVTTEETWTVVVEEGIYKLVEAFAPAEYLVAEPVEFTVQTGEVIKEIEMKDEPIKISGNIDKRQTLAGDNSQYSYTVDYASTSNTFADELAVTDPLESVAAGFTRLDSIQTPVSFDDYDGKMNVWYQTNKNEKEDASDAEEYNACSTNPDNPGNPERERMLDYTGWKIWKTDVSTLQSETLLVSDLKLAEGEYVTAVRFEHGRVEKGFTTRKEEDNLLDTEKSVQDNLTELKTPHESTFNLEKAANKELAKTQKIHYLPAVFSMTVLSKEEYQKGEMELWNSARLDIFRNKGLTDNLKDSDEDKVMQKYQTETAEEEFAAPKTGIRNYGMVFLAAGILFIVAAAYFFRRRSNRNIRL